MSKNVLVTGGAGYIGNFVVKKLLKLGYSVNILDSLIYTDEGLAEFKDEIRVSFFKGDITVKEDVEKSIEGCGGVIALAAIVGDPACSLDEQYTRKVNYESTKILTEVMIEKGIKRVVFASSCSVYGSSNDIKYLTETSKLNPVSLYAVTRIESEKHLLALQKEISPVILRLSTVFGLSPRMRFDLSVNIMSAKAVQNRSIDVFGGSQWRPFVHAKDVAEAFVLAYEADDNIVIGEIFNVGSTDSNYQIEEVANIIKEELPEVKINNNTNIVDQRNYNVIFDKIHKHLNFKTKYSVRDGVREIIEFVGKNHLDVGEPKFSNYLTLKTKLQYEKFIPYAVPDVNQDEKDEILKTIDSGWLSTGPKTRLFEERVKEYFGDDELEVIAVNSCTAGLHLQLLAAGIGEGDEVITTPLTFCATINTILYTGAKPVLVDIDPANYNIDLSLIEKKITSKTKAMVPVYYGGQAVDFEKLKVIADKYDLLILADAAHAMGAKYKNQFCGTFEDSAAFSFYATKNMTTGEGGIITTHNRDWAEKMRRLLSHGMNKDAWKRFSEAGSWYYEIADLGYKYNFTDIQAAFGIHQLGKINRFNEIRRNFGEIYDNSFSNLDGVKTQKVEDYAYHIRHLYPIVIDEKVIGKNRNQIIDELRQNKIGTSVHYVPINHHPFYQSKLNVKIGDFPVSDSIYEGLVSLPLYTKMSKSDINRVIDTLKRIIK